MEKGREGEGGGGRGRGEGEGDLLLSCQMEQSLQ